MSTRLQLPTAVLLTALVAAACSAGSAAPSAATSLAPGSGGLPPAASAAPSPIVEGIAHATGAGEVVLRLEEAGGFVPPEWMAARLPAFTLYGDGRVVFVQASAEVPIGEDNIFLGSPLRTAVLSEAQVQDLLEFALADGGLAVARAQYDNPMVADAPTAIFTVNAENDSKTVSVVALGMENEPGPDAKVLAQLAALSERLRDFDQGGSIASEAYVAPAFRGVILEQQGMAGVSPRPWPWADIQPADFSPPADPMALPQGTRALTPAEASALGVEGFENGIANGVYLEGPDGKVYSFVLRPLLPDETE